MIFLKHWQLKRLIRKARKEVEKREQGKQGNMQNEINVHLQLAKIYQQLIRKPKYPNAKELMLEYYRHAANLGSIEAQYYFGYHKLELGKFWQAFAQDIYGQPIHQDYAKQHYEEAFQYLNEAKKSGFAKAYRTLGLAYIHGSGVTVQKERGFQLVVESIELDKAWDKAPEIFKKLGLNNPEFFSMMMSLKGTKPPK